MQTPRSPRSVNLAYAVVSVLFWVTIVGLAIGLPVGIATTLSSDNPMSVHAVVPPGGLVLPGGVEVVEPVTLSLPIDHLTTAQIAVFHAAIALGGAVVLYGIWQLRQLIRGVRANETFSRPNVRRLRITGWLLLVAYPLFQLAMGWIDQWILSTGGPAIPGARADVDPFSFGAVAGGLCLLVLAEIFSYGLSLREDVEATI